MAFGELPTAAPPGDVERQRDVLRRRQARDQVEGLEHDADALAADVRPPVVVERVERFAVDAHAALARLLEPGQQQQQQRGLARAGRPDDGPPARRAGPSARARRARSRRRRPSRSASTAPAARSSACRRRPARRPLRSGAASVTSPPTVAADDSAGAGGDADDESGEEGSAEERSSRIVHEGADRRRGGMRPRSIDRSVRHGIEVDVSNRTTVYLNCVTFARRAF